MKKLLTLLLILFTNQATTSKNIYITIVDINHDSNQNISEIIFYRSHSSDYTNGDRFKIKDKQGLTTLIAMLGVIEFLSEQQINGSNFYSAQNAKQMLQNLYKQTIPVTISNLIKKLSNLPNWITTSTKHIFNNTFKNKKFLTWEDVVKQIQVATDKLSILKRDANELITVEIMDPQGKWINFGNISLEALGFKSSLTNNGSITKFSCTSGLSQTLTHLLEKPTSQASNNQTITEECPICLESVKNPYKTDCKHVFCETCIKQSLNRNNSCPMCRKKSPQITSLKSTSSINQSNEQPVDNDFCAICQDKINSKFTTLCYHSFCRACLFDWCSNGKTTCPLCRADISSFKPFFR